ncbi:MAG: peroxidase family protein [Umezawaea sp.]
MGHRRSLALVVAVVAGSSLLTGTATGARFGFEVQSLDGTGNNRAHPEWGRAGADYSRVAGVRYADGIGVPVGGPGPRYVSNRVFADGGVTRTSERGVSQWGTAWGQFLDHSFGLRVGGGEQGVIPFVNGAPMEDFHSDIPVVPFGRSAASPGTGVTTPRQQGNELNSYLDAEAVYGHVPDRLTWMRDGARLLMPDDLLPRRDARGDITTAPGVDDPIGMGARAVVTGDDRGNENVSLTAVQTLFAREHNRIVGLLPTWLPEEQRFQLARKVVIATQQYITYTEFLPAMGVRLAPYRGYDPTVDVALSNEFATVGYRAHSMLRGNVVVRTEKARYTGAQLEALRGKGARIVETGTSVEITIPPALGAFRPELVGEVQLGPLLQGLGGQAQSRNDEQVDDVVRSLALTRTGCEPNCQTAIFDIAAIDVERGRDHGIPAYNELRAAYGLAPRTSFRAVTGESTEEFPADPELTPGAEVDDPDSIDFVAPGVRRTTVAARLKALYGDVGALDAFVGMGAEPHVPGTEFGELQLAIWTKQFEAMRDGDRFFHANDPVLTVLRQRFGIDYRHDLGDLIALNTDVPRRQLARDVFRTS